MFLECCSFWQTSFLKLVVLIIKDGLLYTVRCVHRSSCNTRPMYCNERTIVSHSAFSSLFSISYLSNLIITSSSLLFIMHKFDSRFPKLNFIHFIQLLSSFQSDLYPQPVFVILASACPLQKLILPCQANCVQIQFLSHSHTTPLIELLNQQFLPFTGDIDATARYVVLLVTITTLKKFTIASSFKITLITGHDKIIMKSNNVLANN